jgi:hypothetical protein
MAGTPEVQYLVLPDATNPYLLARVRWPDVFQAISAARPDWQDDPGLFDLPYDPNSQPVTLDQAATIAAAWGASLPSDEAAPTSEASLMRRMPADWSNLSRAEKRAWSIEIVKNGKHAAAGKKSTRKSAIEELTQLVSDDRSVATSGSRRGRWRRRRNGDSPSLEPSEPTLVLDEESADMTRAANGAAEGNGHKPAVAADVLDLTETKEDALAPVEDA